MTCFRGHCKDSRYESSPSISQVNIIKLFLQSVAFISAILWLFLEILPYLNVHSGLWTYSQITSLPVSTASNFLWFFCIFGDDTRFECPSQTLNIFLNDITTSEHILQFSMIFLAIFWLFLDRLPYSKMYPGLWKYSPRPLPTVSTTSQFFWHLEMHPQAWK